MRGMYYRWDKKSTTGDYYRLDIAQLARSVNLTTVKAGIWQWVSSNGSKSTVGYSVEPGRGVRVHYQSNDQSYDYVIGVTATPQPFGNVRQWWVCPSCGRRVRILYVGQVFACRRCKNLTYATSQSGDPSTSIDNRIRDIRRKLGASSSGIFDEFPSRPKNMHTRTYLRFLVKHANLQKLRDSVFLSHGAKLVGMGEFFTQSPEELLREYRADPYKLPYMPLIREQEEEPETPLNRFTLGELATLAGVPFEFAQEAVAAGLVKADQGRTTRRKRYRARLKNWLKKLHQLRQTDMTWEEITAWSKRRWLPGNEHERWMPDNVTG